MKKNIFRKIVTIILALVLLFVGVNVYSSTQPSTVRAFGDLVVNFHVGQNLPIFSVNNMAPGDSQDRDVDVTNGGTIPRFVSVKGIQTGGTGTDPKIETVLDIVIKDGSTSIYGAGSLTGAKTLANFLSDSTDPNGVRLNIIAPATHKTYNFKVTFPTSAGDPFQAKSVVFDLTFGEVTSNNVVINEVYYQVDAKHGLDSPADRGVKVNGVSISIRGNGAGSTNQAFVDIENKCLLVQSNQVQIGNNINVGINTGNNSASGNTGGNVNIKSGSASASININNQVNQNNSGACPKVQNDEWIELFNPTEQAIPLKNWTISDNSGISRTILGNRKLNPGQFALISRDDSTWRFWKIPSGVLKIPLGKQIGDGLDNQGDRLILRSDKGAIVDELSYGDDTTIFNPSVPLVSLGASFERLVAGFDTDVASDFKQQNPPTPGK